MKRFFLTLLMVPMLAFSQDVPPVAKVVKPASLQVISKEDLRKTIEHIQQLARAQQEELDQAKLENERIQKDLNDAKVAHREALTNAAVLQQEVNVVTDDRNKQAAEKDKALTDRDYWKQKHSEAVKKLWWWRIWAGGAIGLSGILIILGLLGKFTTWGAKNIAPLVTKGVL